ncbi:respiratory nitrate reductase subunit alpha [Klebsiella pneumoniae]|nr:respiratory nitrate reductase subunit alpha [Klebsiella pneumoniae]
MSKFLDRFRYFKQKGETFADGHGQLLNTNRDWEDGYRQRWQHDKLCVPLTVSTAPAHAAGRFMSKTVW